MPTALRVAMCSVDPIGLTTFDAFDPDSFSVMSSMAEGLIVIDADGSVRPALATSWQRVSPLTMEFELRRGVRFHDGSLFDARDVVATFRAHREPTPSASGGGILAPIIDVIALGEFRVRVETAFPDGMLLHRLFFGQIYARSILEGGGRAAISTHPIATGAYRFVSWERGREIVLELYREHWAGAGSVDRLHLPIVRQKEWIDRLARGEIDVAFNLDAHDAVRARSIPDLVVESRPASSAQAFLLRNQGPLADVRVRRALNHAVHRRVLVELSEHGMGMPQRSVATPQEFGYTRCESYRYSPELARRLLAEAGYAHGFTLRGLVSETSTSLYWACREFLSRVGVRLEAEIVPLGEWMRRIVFGNLRGEPYATDFATISMGNPLSHALFLHFANVFRHGPGSLTRDPEYDAEFTKAATVVDPDEAIPALARLERFTVERALMLFTVQQRAHVAFRSGCHAVPPRAGMPTTVSFWELRAGQGEVERAPAPRTSPDAPEDYGVLLEGTSHLGTFYLPSERRFERPAAERIWGNILVSQERWQLQSEPLLRAVVNLVEAKESLGNVLGSTDRVAIAGYTSEGRCLFVNRGYALLLGTDEGPISERLPKSGDQSWAAIQGTVDASGGWFGPVEVAAFGRYRRLYLTATRAVDDEGNPIGYTLVFSDFSGEEERIKNQAIRTILDNVPYALFACDREGRVMPGYSAASREFFRGATVEGQELVELLGLSEREAAAFRCGYEQVLDDVLPEELAVEQLRQRFHLGDRVCDLSAAALRDASGTITGALFTLLDVTSFVQSEGEADRLRGVVQVLRFRGSFDAFARGLDRELRTLEDLARRGADVQSDARRVIHTAKGVLAQFRLMEISRIIHRLEDETVLTADHFARLRSDLHAMLRANAPLWGISLAPGSVRYSVHEAGFAAIRESLASASSLEEARSAVSAVIENLRRRPIGELVGPIEDSCRAHAARLGKQIEVETSGLELEVPERLLPVLNATVHLTRNAIDHGLEPPEERGDKPPRGRLEIRAFRKQDCLVLEVEDDGRGIDRSAVLAKAVDAGLLTAHDAATTAEARTFDLLFQEGLSTSSAVSETSGRGVGLAAVRAAVRAQDGVIEVESWEGRGTLFRVRVPLGPAAALVSMPPMHEDLLRG